MSHLKSEILLEIDHRLEKLREHQYDEIIVTGNQYDELNQALAKVIGAPLISELENLKSYIEKLN